MNDAKTLADLKDEFITQMESDGYTTSTIDGYKRAVDIFYEYLEERKVTDLSELTKAMMKNYRGYLHYLRKDNGEPLAQKTIADRIIGLRLFFKIMLRNGHVLYDFSKVLAVPRMGRQIPRTILTQDEVIQILKRPDTTTALGYRDRVVLEILYGTGMRNGELRNLKVTDINLEQNEIRINNGKGGVDRLVPTEPETTALIGEYIEKVYPLFAARSYPPAGASRPCFAQTPPAGTNTSMYSKRKGGKHGYLFMGRFGRPLSKDTIWSIVKRYAKECNIEKKVSCHVFRHSIATHLLESGMDIRYIQELLGHKSLMSTQIYTRVAITDLRKAFKRYHPKEMRRRKNGQLTEPTS